VSATDDESGQAFRLRRLSDGSLLPTTFVADDLRETGGADGGV
jgi:hypothetical protein